VPRPCSIALPWVFEGSLEAPFQIAFAFGEDERASTLLEYRFDTRRRNSEARSLISKAARQP
jgi:hypothetical protein